MPPDLDRAIRFFLACLVTAAHLWLIGEATCSWITKHPKERHA